MKINNICHFIILLAVSALIACSPDEYVAFDNENPNPKTIDSIHLMLNHSKLIADGKAELELYPKMFDNRDFKILDTRVKEEWIEYISDTNIDFKRRFSVSDVSLIGKTVTVKMQIKGTNIQSNPVSFEIVAPLDEKFQEEITIPVIFHIIQTVEDIESYGGEYSQDRIEKHLTKINHLFAGTSSKNAVGVNTHIKFQLAEYDNNGNKMLNHGINRHKIQDFDKALAKNNFADFLKSQNLIWSPDKYLNIWLISDRKEQVFDFANTYAKNCRPLYVYPNTPIEQRPQGVKWQTLPNNKVFQPKEIGIIYRLQDLDLIDRKINNASGFDSGANELAHYIGSYLGLLPTFVLNTSVVGNDYCDDTINYWGSIGSPRKNTTWYKEMGDFYFRSENIMDDPTGLHISVSKNQCERMRWVLNNCPERAAWKSDFAFTGQ